MASKDVLSTPIATLAPLVNQQHYECIKRLTEREEHATRSFKLTTENVTSLLLQQLELNFNVSKELNLCRERLQAAHIECLQLRIVMGWEAADVQKRIDTEMNRFDQQISTFLAAGKEEEVKLKQWLKEVNSNQMKSLQEIEDRKIVTEGTHSRLLQKVTTDICLPAVEVMMLQFFLEGHQQQFMKEEEYLQGIQQLQEEAQLAKVAHHKKMVSLIDMMQATQHQRAKKVLWLRKTKEDLYQDFAKRLIRLRGTGWKNTWKKQIKLQAKAVDTEFSDESKMLKEKEETYKKEIVGLEEELKAALGNVHEKGEEAGQKHEEWKKKDEQKMMQGITAFCM